MTLGPPPDLLAAIMAATRRRVELARDRVPVSRLMERAAVRSPNGKLFARRLVAADRISVVAECKRRSPSRGVLRCNYDPAALARAYEAAGAFAVSVVTEPGFFDGSLQHLEQVREAVGLPLLRKDFVFDDYQLLEARASGADAVLLIVAALTPACLRGLVERAGALGLASLVEVRDEEELAVALDAGAAVVGVNQRNLHTLEVDMHAAERLSGGLPDHIVAVAESGVRGRDDLRRLREAGYDACLVGERLVTDPEPGRALRELIG